MGFHGVGDKSTVKRTRSSVQDSHIYPYKATVEALISLSSAKSNISADRVVDLIVSSPDPETAKHSVEECFYTSHATLSKKWNELAVSIWSHSHPHIPLLPHVPLTSEDVSSVPVLRDVECFLHELQEKSADIIHETAGAFLSGEDALRLALVLPSWQGIPLMAVEHESALPTVHRLRVLLQSAGLVRIHQHKLKVVQSHFQSFLRLPPVQRYYVLWHTEAYHVMWNEFAGMWARPIEIVQGYLPLLWDLHSDVEVGESEDARGWSESLIDTFLPIWEQEGIAGEPGSSVLTMYQQAALPAVIEQLVLRDVLVRYGLLKGQASEVELLVGQRQELGIYSDYTWTALGKKLVQAEHANDLPCGIELLKEMGR